MKNFSLNILLFCAIYLNVFSLKADERDLFENYLSEGIAAFMQSNIPKTAEYFDKCIEIDPNNYLSWYWRGVSYANRPDMSLAKQSFDHAIKLAPSEPTLYAMRGHLKINKVASTDNVEQFARDFVDGMNDIEKALSLASNNVPGCYYKAILLMRLEQHDKAIPYLQLVLEATSDKERFDEKQQPRDYRLSTYCALSEIYTGVARKVWTENGLE